MAAFGFKREDYKHELIEVWPENHQAFTIFDQMRTQWRVGFGGPTGLDHNVLLRRLDRLNLSDDDYRQIDADVRLMELHMLEAFAEEREKREQEDRQKRG